MFNLILMLFAGPLFLVSIAAHIFVKLKMRPSDDIDEYHFEFEDHHPDYARYEKWSRITFVSAVIAVLLMFVAVYVW